MPKKDEPTLDLMLALQQLHRDYTIAQLYNGLKRLEQSVADRKRRAEERVASRRQQQEIEDRLPTTPHVASRPELRTDPDQDVIEARIVRLLIDDDALFTAWRKKMDRADPRAIEAKGLILKHQLSPDVPKQVLSKFRELVS
jgi:hypothetical protein